MWWAGSGGAGQPAAGDACFERPCGVFSQLDGFVTSWPSARQAAIEWSTQ